MNRNTEYFQHLHDVAKQIVDDPGSADADLAAALKSATMKLATQYGDPTHALKTLYLGDSELSSLLRQAVAIVTKDDDDDDGDDEIIEKARPRDYVGAQGLAAAVMDHALDRLAHLPRRGVFEKKEITPMESIEMLKAERTEKLLAIGKSPDNDAHGIDEHEYTRIVTEHARCARGLGPSPLGPGKLAAASNLWPLHAPRRRWCVR